ncbi:gliding motility-associated-like protein [Gelidibacter algens]|uniref:Gliding motility-associated-like protein n=1 Tax=Gelidibacter algens TaxID=49280 RepID=A0A327SCF9_9FLAO|nr:T9SS type B sorting domain-containing protein [Gelidibacter algens]RAJ25343.1 gliding motility-associated-like protein [Gelidibacter algens]
MYSQNEASYWYFGRNAGVKFNSANGSVTALTDGQLNTLEGCTTISDSNGNLLFYSDGRTIWNKNHQPMANASEAAGTGLLGDDSSTSSGLIVPKPQDPNFYYIFAVDEPHHLNSSAYPNTADFSGDGVNNGLTFSLVDMTLNGGLGDVVSSEKNMPLITYDVNNPNEVDFKCSEKITAVKADDCYSIWVITQFIDKFYAFKIESEGVIPTPVVSKVGPTVPISGYRRNALGYLKASPDGTKLVAAHLGFATQLGTEAAGGVYLFDFDNDTGIVSNSVELYAPQQDDSPYGVEFSADNKKVYATIDERNSSKIVQWDLSQSNIPNSQVVIHRSEVISGGALQLAINKKIYRAQRSFQGLSNLNRYLGVIENPEANGNAVVYNQNGVLLDVNNDGSHTSSIGLPPFIQSLFNTQVDIIQNGTSVTELRLCEGESYTLKAEFTPNSTYAWTKDGLPLSETSEKLFVDTTGFYEVFIEPNNGECPIVGQAFIGIFEIPVANTINDDSICGTTDTVLFDLTTYDANILGTQNPSTFEVHYFESLKNANLNQFPIVGNYNNTSRRQEIFARVQNKENPNCFATTSFFIEVFITPQIDNFTDIEFCDTEGNTRDGIATIDLNLVTPEAVGMQDMSLYTISYHPSQLDADKDVNPLPLNYRNTTPNKETIFIRLENNLNQSCYSIRSFNITINPLPEAFDSRLIQCDEDGNPEGFTTFNLNQAKNAITGGASDRNLEYYYSMSDAENGLNKIDGSAFRNVNNPQVIYVKVINDLTNCSSLAQLTLVVSTTSANDAQLTHCDDDGTEDGYYTFTLSKADTSVLDTLPAGLDLFYYATYEDALLENNPLPNNFMNTVPYSQTIHARVENSNACYGISEVKLTVFKMPNVELETETIYCLNNFPQTITLDGGVIGDAPSNYTYTWSTGESTSEIMVNAAGTYTVRVTNTAGCFKDRSVTVLPSNIATIKNIEINDGSQNNTVTVMVTGEGDYDYALDAITGPYQENATFDNVAPGFHTVFVRDTNGCGVSEKLISVIGFPKYFTPNNDGINDYWQIYGINEQFQSKSTIYIFDRMGKLLKELNPLNSGWDGTYIGKQMAPDDYWFSVTLQDGRTFKGHFTLKR